MSKLNEAYALAVTSEFDTRLDQCSSIIVFELKKNKGLLSTRDCKQIMSEYGFATATYTRALAKLANDGRIFTRRGSKQYTRLLRAEDLYGVSI
jgi:DNA-binding transcriptional regulator YhcF (GntR family)